MIRGIYRPVVVLAIVAMFGAIAPIGGASAATSGRGGKTITGTLSKPGYTVLVLGYNGKAAVSKARSFKIKAPDARVTVQLLDKHGKYAGPVVVAGSGAKVYEGVKAGAQLGKINVLAGYARTAKPLAGKSVDRGRWVQARKGVPLGNGRNFGLARSKFRNGSSGPGGDSSRTGVPNALSIDADGDGVIDVLKPMHRKGKAFDLRTYLASDNAPGPASPNGNAPGPASPNGSPGGGSPGGPGLGNPNPGPGSGAVNFSFFSQIFLDLNSTLNADAAGVSTADIDNMLPQALNIVGTNVPSGDQVALDCGGLSYCSPGGSGALSTGGPSASPSASFSPWPSCCDPSGDGFGVLRGPGEQGLGGDRSPNNWAFFYPRATSSQIGSGDAFVLRSTSNGTLTEAPVTLSFVFDTVPALASYDDGAGHSGAITYPATASDPGTQSNPVPVGAGSNGDVVLTLHFWPPQRKGIAGAGEPAFMDIGGLNYYIDQTSLAQNADMVNHVPQSGGPHSSECSVASLSTSDPNLSVTNSGPSMGELADSSTDQPASPSHVRTFGVDLTKCLTDGGASGFPVGAQGAIGLAARASSSGDHAVQNIWVKRVA